MSLEYQRRFMDFFNGFCLQHLPAPFEKMFMLHYNLLRHLVCCKARNVRSLIAPFPNQENSLIRNRIQRHYNMLKG